MKLALLALLLLPALARPMDVRVAGNELHLRGQLFGTEFGAFRPVSPADDRAAWLRDVRSALERRQIAWTAWSYFGGFGVVDGPAGQRVIHAPTARALLGE